LVAKIKGLGSVPVLITLPPILSETYFSYISRSMSDEQKNNIKEWLGGDIGIITRWHESYNRALFQVANQTRTQIIDITTPFDTFRGDLTSLYCADGIHPNARGHKLIAHTIINMYL
jgi:lysophospholipase L1-like esterase